MCPGLLTLTLTQAILQVQTLTGKPGCQDKDAAPHSGWVVSLSPTTKAQ